MDEKRVLGLFEQKLGGRVDRKEIGWQIRRARAEHAPLERRPSKQLSDEQAARLEALGYLN